MFTNIQCLNTINGKLLSWEYLEGHSPLRISIYGTYEGKQWTLLEDDCPCNWFLDNTRTLGLEAVYKLVGIDQWGNRYERDNIGTSTSEDKSGRIAKEMHRRETIMFKAHPYGRADVVILMRKNSGRVCPTCGAEANCPTKGLDTSCPDCYGTGYLGGYYIYPKKEEMLLLNEHDDKLQPPPEVARNGAVQFFRTVFTGMIREKDLLCVGMDLYTVVASQCIASVGTIPVAYQLTTVKLLPGSYLYDTLLEKVKNVR